MQNKRVFAVVATVLVTGAVAFVVFTASDAPEPVAPAESPSPETSQHDEGKDIGLEFPVCDVSRLGRVDLLGDGITGTAWTASTATNEGRCKPNEHSYVVAVDVTGDGAADASSPLKWCFVCEPAGTTDLDADGDDELVVLAQGGSVSEYLVFSASGAADGSVAFDPLLVAAPGNGKGDLRPGRPLAIRAGGDEGLSTAVACERYPEAPVLVVAWSYHLIDGPGSETSEVHVTRLVLRDDAFHVIDALNTSQPTLAARPEVFSGDSEACGLEFGL